MGVIDDWFPGLAAKRAEQRLKKARADTVRDMLIAKNNALLDKHGLILDCDPRRVATAGAATPADASTDSTDDKTDESKSDAGSTDSQDA